MENNVEYNNNNETSIFIGNNTTYDEYVLFERTEKASRWLIILFCVLLKMIVVLNMYERF